MLTVIVIIIGIVALAAVGYSIYLHKKLVGLKQIYEDVKDLLDGDNYVD